MERNEIECACLSRRVLFSILLLDFSFFFSISCQYSDTKLLMYFRNTSNLKFTFCITLDTFHRLKLLHWTQNELVKEHFTRIWAQNAAIWKPAKKHQRGKVLKAFCLQLYASPWYCCHVQNMKPLRFMLTFLPFEGGIYVEEISK